MIGLELLRHRNRFLARVRRRLFSAEPVRAGNTSAFAGYLTPGDVILADVGFDIQESRIHQGEKAVGWH